MKTMNGFTNELLAKKAKRNWRTRCGAFLLAVLASWYGGDAVFGDAIITKALTGTDVYQNTTNNMDSDGRPGTATDSQYVWTGANTPSDGISGLNLGAYYNGMNVNTSGGGTTLSTANSALQVAGGATFKFSQNISWGGGEFRVNDSNSTATIKAQSGTLNFNSYLNNYGTLNITENWASKSGSRNAKVQLGSGVNSGTINVNYARVEHNNSGFSGGGTIALGRYGVLEITSGDINQNISGQFNYDDDGKVGYGAITGTGNIDVNDTVSGSVAFDGGGRFDLNNTNTGITALYVMNNSEVRLTEQDNIGVGPVTLYNGGGLTREDGNNVGDVEIANAVRIEIRGSLNSGRNSTLSWTANADSKYDSGFRFILSNTVSTPIYSVGGATLHINDQSSGAGGTVVLKAANDGLVGGIQIHNGVLEISNQRNIGPSNDTNYQTVTIGDGSSARAAFRVVGTQNREETITHWIDLTSQNSFYEVYTDTYMDGTTLSNSARAGLSDADRFTVVQAGQVIGQGDLNKSGDGILYLTSNNSYKGDTVVWHGVLRIDNTAAINNSTGAALKIGGAANMADASFRPVFETVLPTGKSDATMTIVTNVYINQRNSTIRTTGEGNRTIFTGTIDSEEAYVGTNINPTLIKEGAGTMVLDGMGQWGNGGDGNLEIVQGTVEFSANRNLAGGTITIGTAWHSHNNIEEFDSNSKEVVYKAILKLADNCTQAIGNEIILASPAPLGTDDPASGSYLEVGTASVLTVTGNITQAPSVTSNLNKIGAGELVLKGSNNLYTGWTNIYEGTASTVTANNMANSAGVNLIGNGTTFDMSASSSDQTLYGLKGADRPNIDDPTSWTRRVYIGDNTLTLLQEEDTATLHGAILGKGTLVKGGVSGSVFETGFEIGSEKFEGAAKVQTGTLRALTDVTLTGLTGNAGTYFDIRNNTLTLDINENMQYSGTIISSYPSTPYEKNVVRPHVIKDGIGTIKAGFSEKDPGSGVIKGFYGDLTINQGSIVSTSDYYMDGGGKLTFGVNTDLSGAIQMSTLDVRDHNVYFRQGGASGSEYSTVHVNVGDMSTGWSTPSGVVTVAKILGGDQSDYKGLVASTTDSLFYGIELQEDRGTGYNNRNVNLKVGGFGGIGDTYNTRAVGQNLDNVRVADLTDNAISSLLKDLWAAGSNMTDETTKQERTELLLDIYQQLSGDTIANGMFMGLDKPWQAAFNRLNLDCQMVYVGQQGGKIANMRNLWFTPTVQSLTARGDGNARKFGIDRPGYKIGFDKRVAQNTSVGFQLGYSSPKLHQGDDRIEASDFQFGLYGGSMVGNYIEMKGFIGFGHQNFKSNRNVYLPNDKILDDGNDGLRAIGGANRSMTTHGRYDGDTFNFSFEVSRPLFLGFTIVRPTIGLDSEHAFRYAFTETGDVIAMKYERSSLSRTRARFGLSFETTTLERAIFTGRIGYSCLLGGNDYAEAKGQFVGVSAPNQVVRSVAVGKSYFEAGVGMRVFLNQVKTLALVGNYDATIGNRWAEHQGSAGITYLY